MALLALACSAIAAPPTNPPGQNKLRLTIQTQVTLEPLTIGELLGGGSTTEPFDGTDPGLVFFPVTREVADLWRVKLPPPQVPPALQVNYYLVGANGTNDVLSLPGSPASMIDVVLEEIAPMNVGGPPGAIIVQGGVRLLMDPNQAQRAGQYTGTLTVEVNRL